ncbi:caspase-2-like [Diadema setosum]|uniref:caspase-2-like n=1 Tax=Diadema setosum TaxID=31175 RepID=UPI003B3A12DE
MKELHSLKDEIKKFHTSVVIVLMSHGTEEGILGTDDKVVQMKEIKEVFSGRNCPQLNGKPKIFFIQACRGDKLTQLAMDSAVEPFLQRVHMDNSLHLQVDGCGNPENADMFICYATSEGYVSLRNPDNGSWFIQALCEELIVRAHKDDLYTIMTKVSQRVKRLEGDVKLSNERKVHTYQTPQIVCQGIGKKIYFLPKYPSE